MKSAIILALTSSTLAMPFGDIIDVVFGTANEPRQLPPPDQMPGFQPIGTGSGTGFPFPTATGAFPTESDGMHILPYGPGSGFGHRHKSKTLAIDYQLAPTAVPNVKKRQNGGSALPSFSLLDPTDGVPAPTSTDDSSSPFPTEDPGSQIPTPSGGSPFPIPTQDPESPVPTDEPAFPFPTASGEPAFPMPTGGFPFPSGGMPFPIGGGGSGIPSLPTTMATMTRGPRPTVAPEFPGQEDGENGSGNGQSWLDWFENLFGGGKSETQN